MVAHVLQEDAYGCVIASAAMILGRSYQDVKAEVEKRLGRGIDDSHGITHLDFIDLVIDGGWWTQLRYKYGFYNRMREPWPAEPWADYHYCQVNVTESSPAHAVIMLADGAVLDPLTTEPRRLSDYYAVNLMIALKK